MNRENQHRNPGQIIREHIEEMRRRTRQNQFGQNHPFGPAEREAAEEVWSRWMEMGRNQAPANAQMNGARDPNENEQRFMRRRRNLNVVNPIPNENSRNIGNPGQNQEPTVEEDEQDVNQNRRGNQWRRNPQGTPVRIETNIHQGQNTQTNHRVKRVTTNVSTRRNGVTVVVTLFLLMIIAASAKEMAIIFTNVAKAHVSYDQFKLVYHADIKLPYKMRQQIQTLMEKAETTCSEISEGICEAEINELREKMEDTNQELDRLNSYDKSKRTKRSWCDTCGWAMKKVYGVMDSESAQEYASKINQLQNETLSQHELMKQQVLLSETTLEVNRNISKKLDERTRKTIRDLKELEDELARSEMKEYFDELTQLITIMLERQSRAITKIKRALQDTSIGGIPELIPAALLEQDIQQIQGSLPSDTALPIHIENEPAGNIFMYTTMRASKTEDKLLIEITIPIVSRMEYRLLKTTPIPFEINGYTMIVQPQARYFLLDRDETRYIALNDRDMLTEIKIGPQNIIYRPSAIVRLDKDNVCEWKAFGAQNPKEILQSCKTSQIPTANYVVEVNEDDIYYISIATPLAITEVCNSSIISHETLSTDRLVKLKPNCSIKTTLFTIQSKNTYEINIDHIITPVLWNESISDEQLQQIVKTPFTKANISDPILITEFHQLDHLIEQTKEQARKADYDVKFEQIQQNATRTSIWSMVSGLLTTIGLLGPIIAFIAYKTGICKCSNGTSTNLTIISTAGNTPHPMKKTARKQEELSAEWA